MRYTALLTLLRLAERFSGRREMVTVETLATELKVRTSNVDPIIRRLEEIGLIIEVRQDHTGKNHGLLLTVYAAANTPR
jgi:DNA-binding MarR family transcriptional regulator